MGDHGSELSGRILGAAIEVHRHLGAGFKEITYENALAIEFEIQGISFQRQEPTELNDKGRSIGDGVMDFLVEGEVVVELKALEKLNEAHKTQVVAYLQSTGLRLGLLINFHAGRIADGVVRIAA